jgi:hypothetical protein
VIVAEYKATARKEAVNVANIYPGYRRQVETFQYLLEQQGLVVEPRAWFVYANGIPYAGGFGDVLSFRTLMLSYDGDRSWVLGSFRQAVGVATSAVRPAAAENCPWCNYVAARA